MDDERQETIGESAETETQTAKDCRLSVNDRRHVVQANQCRMQGLYTNMLRQVLARAQSIDNYVTLYSMDIIKYGIEYIVTLIISLLFLGFLRGSCSDPSSVLSSWVLLCAVVRSVGGSSVAG